MRIRALSVLAAGLIAGLPERGEPMENSELSSWTAVTVGRGRP